MRRISVNEDGKIYAGLQGAVWRQVAKATSEEDRALVNGIVRNTVNEVIWEGMFDSIDTGVWEEMEDA
jgi:hypothetical protein